jgi:hypothetical protein
MRGHAAIYFRLQTEEAKSDGSLADEDAAYLGRTAIGYQWQSKTAKALEPKKATIHWH